MGFLGFDEDLPGPGVDLRLYIFDGLPPAAFEDWADDAILAFGAEGFGAEPAVKPPPAPNLKDPTSIRAYLAEIWRVSAVARKAYDAHAQEIYARISKLPTAKTPQTMIADVITAGPLTTHPLAAKFYAIAQSLQAQVKAKTKENPIAATAGLLQASAAKLVADKVDAAKKTVERTVSAPVHVVRDVTQAARATQQQAIEAARAVATMPGNMVRDVTSVPKNLVDKVADTANNYIATARELAPQLAPYFADIAKSTTTGLADTAGKLGFGLGIGVLTLGVVVGGAVLAVKAGPAYIAAGAVGGKRR